MKIKDREVGKFLNELASVKPTPGGGAVAALAGAMAAALVEMVINLSKSKELKAKSLKVKELRENLLKLADKDVSAFDKVVMAYRSKDKGLIKKALSGAIAVPEETKKLSQRVEVLGVLVEKEGNKNAVSDARTAIYLAQTAQRSAQENIDINKSALARLG